MNSEQLAKFGCNALIDLFNEVQDVEGEQHEIALDFERDGVDYKIIMATGPALAARSLDVAQISAALDSAIEQITAQLVHGEVTNEGWQTTLNELIAAQQKQEGGE